MENTMFSFGEFHCGGFRREGEEQRRKQSFFETGNIWDTDYLCSDYSLYQENSFQKGLIPSKEDQVFPEFTMCDYMDYDMVPAEKLTFQEPSDLAASLECNQSSLITEDPMLVEPKKAKGCSKSLSSLGILNSYGSGYKRLNGENLKKPCSKTNPTLEDRQLSTEEIMRIAGTHYIQLSVRKEDDHLMMLGHHFGSMLSSLSDEESKDVELVRVLLASAEKLGNQQYDRASKLLMQCDYLASSIGNPVQRIVYHFADALWKRFERETGRVSSKGSMENGKWGEAVEEMVSNPKPILLSCHRILPFSQVMQFTEIQAILDTVATERRIHLIDLEPRTGVQWTILMHALAVRFTCPVELLKISAVGISEEKVVETGKWLESFAQTLNLPFIFKAVIVSDMKDLNEELFELDANETVGVYASAILKTMIVRPDCLENLMKVIRRLNPCIMIVTEVEANHNSPSFLNRFVDALFYYSAWFDCFDTYMDRNDCDRMAMETNLFSQAIRCILATEGSERIIRNVRIDVWRSFFTRSGFEEIELSQLSLYQADLIVKEFDFASSWTLDMNGKCFTIGWKGTPLLFVSAWKLQ
ncbi:DELLA protein RGL1-like [Tasmannia lanceolata]|uniref:DELLA protein RGL1-like n=1 Tax=Tasmannia lanceolata TaxID=3420 RepID=UPI00406293D3